MPQIHRSGLLKKLYSQDASMYQETPMGVSFPRNKKDIQRLVLQAEREGFTITARSAGTSLAGQTTGSGVIMDVSRYMDHILELDPEARRVKVEPGVIRDTLNREAGKYDLLFGPDTATTNRCMIGGMIGNNSAGSFSIKYKSTREHVLEVNTILSDGSEVTFKPLSDSELEDKMEQEDLEGSIYREMIELLKENKDLIKENYPHPEIIRRNTGYALDKLCEMSPIDPEGRPFNLAELLCGSEGTLAITTSATLNLEQKPKFSRLIIPQFRTLDEAMKATVEAVKYDPSAVELVDHVILNATKENLEQKQNRFFLEGDPEFILIIQLEGDNAKDLKKRSQQLAKELKKQKLGYTSPELDDPLLMSRVWELRKAGLGLLMGLGKESRTPAFCEDTAVRVEDLPQYVEDFNKILTKYNTSCVFYAHASVGELHLRPMIDTTTREGLLKMEHIAEEVAELVRSYRGSLSGEHGDGRARAPYIGKVIGKEVLPLLRKVKEIWDPWFMFNPGKIVEPKPIGEGLRYSPDYKQADVETVFKWRKEGGLPNAVELCNGAGVCRKLAESGGTMCPSYMATKEEKDSTRGRANVFRQVFSGEDPESFGSEDLKEALDLCLSCKACKSECPANVDMAKMKAEFTHGWHQKHGISLKESFFSRAGKFYKLAALIPGLTNLIIHSGIGKRVLEMLFGISAKRNLPSFSSSTFHKWFRKRDGLKSEKKVVLIVDLFTDYHDPKIGQSAVLILEEMGFEVIVPKIKELGRVQISKGMLDDAKKISDIVLTELYSYAEQEISIIGLEPSEILTLRDEFLDIVDADQLASAERISAQSATFEEFISQHVDLLPQPMESRKVILHGHCHSKALTGNNATVSALEAAGYEVEELDTGCCGMAGSFGYETDKADLSLKIGSQRLFPEIEACGEDCNISAPGFSCRHQIMDGTGKMAEHPAVLISENLIGTKKPKTGLHTEY